MSTSSQESGFGEGETDVEKLNKEIRAMNRKEFSKWYNKFLTSIGDALSDGLIAWFESLEKETRDHLKQIVPAQYSFIEGLVDRFRLAQYVRNN